MSSPTFFQWLADVVLVAHAGFVAFVVAGLPLIAAGNRWGWSWVNGWTFRLAHLLAICIVVLLSWLGTACPLTQLEMALRARARASTYSGSFIEYWLQRLLYYEAPEWVFVLVYTLFALAVVAAWWRYPPTRRRPH